MSDIIYEVPLHGRKIVFKISLEEIVDCQPLFKLESSLTGEELTALLAALEDVEDKDVEELF